MTSTTHTGDLGGIAGGDGICNDRAADAGLPGVYKAWLATSDADAPTNSFAQATGPYLRTDGVLVALDYADLVSGTIINPIDIDEFGVSPGSAGSVWTNVNPVGGFVSNTDLDSASCQGWNSDGGGFTGKFGGRIFFGGAWSDADAGGPNAPCGEDLRLYCFGQ